MMIEPGMDGESQPQEDDAISVIASLSLLLKWRRLILVLGLTGGLLGLTVGLMSTRMYVSFATFIPQGSDAGASGIALAASQLGLRVPSTGNAWGPPIYVELLRARSLLEPIATDTLVVTEEKGQRISVMDLLRADAPTPEKRLDLAVRTLSGLIMATEDKKLGAVRLTVKTQWPSVSQGLADRLLRGVNDFNLKTRKSQAASERQFVDSRAEEAETALRAAEDRLQAHIQQNRVIANSPELVFERDRLQREVQLRQQVFTSLVMNREEAKIREVRDTPVITVLQAPGLPIVGEARKSVQKGVLGGIAGGILAILIAFAARSLAETQQKPSEETAELLQTLEEAAPRFLVGMLRRRTSR